MPDIKVIIVDNEQLAELLGNVIAPYIDPLVERQINIIDPQHEQKPEPSPTIHTPQSVV